MECLRCISFDLINRYQNTRSATIEQTKTLTIANNQHLSATFVSPQQGQQQQQGQPALLLSLEDARKPNWFLDLRILKRKAQKVMCSVPIPVQCSVTPYKIPSYLAKHEVMEARYDKEDT
ncbi:hypothetical protein E2C01_027441 [Portunus trituberculatus]|uniref:Uncharacterized protein n=1 Tax=Portunus trituberculatus TaxID=210409 RepID=A0A5B7EKU8_PORTR|nr:hypothetical protein [Portunus trituberculatus]